MRIRNFSSSSASVTGAFHLRRKLLVNNQTQEENEQHPKRSSGGERKPMRQFHPENRHSKTGPLRGEYSLTPFFLGFSIVTACRVYLKRRTPKRNALSAIVLEMLADGLDNPARSLAVPKWRTMRPDCGLLKDRASGRDNAIRIHSY